MSAQVNSLGYPNNSLDRRNPQPSPKYNFQLYMDAVHRLNVGRGYMPLRYSRSSPRGDHAEEGCAA